VDQPNVHIHIHYPTQQPGAPAKLDLVTPSEVHIQNYLDSNQTAITDLSKPLPATFYVRGSLAGFTPGETVYVHVFLNGTRYTQPAMANSTWTTMNPFTFSGTGTVSIIVKAAYESSVHDHASDRDNNRQVSS